MYSVLRKIGEGGMGDVYLVEDPRSGSRYAVKVLRQSFQDYIPLQRFRREFRALQSLEHPGIVKVFSMSDRDGPGYFVMEYVEGDTLDAIFRHPVRCRERWVERFLGYGMEVCAVLEHIHGRRMVHRDLKPSNIMIRRSGDAERVTLLDFGLIQWPDRRTVLTDKQTVLGSALYMSPEQGRGGPVDSRSDLYSFGVILYEGLMGQVPFMSDNPVSVLGMHQMKPPVPIRTLYPELPGMLDDLVLSLLEKKPGDRPSSARDVGEAIRSILARPLSSSELSVPLLPAGGNLFEPDFVGRMEAMSAVQELSAGIRNGATWIVLILGEAGIGKSRFMRQVIRLFELEGWAVAVGAFQEADFHVYGGISRAVQGLEPRNGECSRFGGDPADADTIRESANRILDLLPGTDRNPRILALDDIHLADSENIRMIGALVREHQLRTVTAAFPGLLILCSGREEVLKGGHPWNELAGDLTRKNLLRVINLDRLDETRVGEIANSMLGKPLNGDSVKTLYRCSEGIPLFACEMLKDAAARNWLEYRRGTWFLKIGEEGVIPGRIGLILNQRFAAMNDAAWVLLRAAGVLGYEFEGTIHERLCNRTESGYLDDFDLLLRSQIFREIPGTPDGYRFGHSLLREYVLKKTSRRRLQVLHRQAADILMAQHSDRNVRIAGTIAFHLESGLRFREAYGFRKHAAEKVSAAGFPMAALLQLRRAGQDLEKGDFSPEERAREEKKLGIDLGALERRFGNVERAETLLRTARERAGQEGDIREEGRALMQLGVIYGTRGQFDTAGSFLESALELFRKIGDRPLICDCLNNLGAAASAACMDELSARHHGGSLAEAVNLEDPEKTARSLLNLAYLNSNTGADDTALAYFSRALELTRGLKNRRLAAFNLYGLAGLYFARASGPEEWTRVLRLLDEAVAVLETSGDRAILANCLHMRAQTKLRLGRNDEKDVELAFQIAREMGIKGLLESIQSLRKQPRGRICNAG